MTEQQISKIVLPSVVLKQGEYDCLECHAFDYKGYEQLQTSWNTQDTVDFGTVLGSNADWVSKKCAWILVQTPNHKQFMIPTNTNVHGSTDNNGRVQRAKQVWAQVPRGTTPTIYQNSIVGLPNVAGG